jgi:tRNA threonylcarbamoyladenosine biosynthesis protein TsaB
MIRPATRLLCLDTSTTTAGVAIVDGAGTPLAQAQATADRHSAHLLRLCDEVLRAAGMRPADLDAFACGAGPGSFTGLRVGLAVVKGLALGTGKPLLLVSSLEVLAHDIARAVPRSEAGVVVPCIDAGKGEVYAAVCPLDEAGGVRALGEPWRLTPAEMVARLGGVGAAVVAGNGAERYADVLDAALPAGVRRRVVDGPTAISIGHLALPRFARGEVDDLDGAVPFYGRAPDITTKKPPPSSDSR